MTDRPILFSPPMVRALLDGRKTQTRRILSRRNTYFNGGTWPKALDFEWCNWAKAWVDPGPSPAGNAGPYLHVDWPYGRVNGQDDDETLGARIYPKAQPGDRLWVRETWWIAERYSYGTTPGGSEILPPALAVRRDPVHYAANGNPPNSVNRHYGPNGLQGGHFAAPDPYAVWVKKSSIHMTRWASRLTLEVTGVKVERLQDISNADAVAEGAYVGKASRRVADDYLTMAICGHWFASAQGWYRDLWDRINGAGAWAANPWVIATTFTVRNSNIDGGAA